MLKLCVFFLQLRIKNCKNVSARTESTYLFVIINFQKNIHLVKDMHVCDLS
jgi:hypothetical protein